MQPHLKTDASCTAMLGELVMRTSVGSVACQSLQNANISWLTLNFLIYSSYSYAIILLHVIFGMWVNILLHVLFFWWILVCILAVSLGNIDFSLPYLSLSWVDLVVNIPMLVLNRFRVQTHISSFREVNVNSSRIGLPWMGASSPHRKFNLIKNGKQKTLLQYTCIGNYFSVSVYVWWI